MRNVIPEPHAGYAQRVCDLVESDGISLRDRISTRSRLSDSYLARLVEDPRIVCVAGERGSGKTTVLATAAARLAEAGHVVIPPVRPEYFAAPASLLPTAVAHLLTFVRTDWVERRGRDRHEAPHEITTAIVRTLSDANLVSGGAPDASLLRADEQAADLSLVASTDADFMVNWARVTAQVRERASRRRGAAKDPMLVIPVDDPDLAPGTLRQILLDLRMMTSVDGVVAIVCFDLDEARSVLSDAYARSYASPPSALLSARVVDAQIAKAFPDDRKVVIRGLGPDQRLAFTALDRSQPSLERICESHRVRGLGEADTLASVFRMPLGRKPSLYTNALPSNPRDLRGFAYRLASIEPSDASSGEAAMELCETAVMIGLKQSGAIDPALWPAGPLFERLGPVDGKPACMLRLDNVSYHGSGRWLRAFPSSRDEGTFVSLGHSTGVEASRVVRGRETRTIQALHPSLAYALLLVREFSDYYSVIDCATSGPVPMKGGDRPSSTYLRVHIGSEETDDRFLNAPAWEAYYDYFVLDAASTALIPVATAPHELSDPRLAIEAYVIDFCRHVTSIQARRRPARDPARVSRLVRRADDAKAARLVDRELERLYGEIGDCLELDEGRAPDTLRMGDFRRWVESGLPNVCHGGLVRPEFTHELLRHRADLLKPRHRLAAANANLARVLEGRIKKALDEPWVVELIPTVSEFDPQLGEILLASHSAALETIERSRHRLLGESAIVPPARATGELDPGDAASDFEIALDVLDRLEADARARIRRAGS